MQLRAFLKAGHTPSLLCAFLYFDTSFMVWVLLGALANSIVPEFGLNEAQRGLMLAIPLLGGSLLRLVIGLMTDHFGARRTGIIGMLLTLVPLLIGWIWADSFPAILWYPPQYQGMAMGIAGAGNSGTALATLFAPMLARSLGWHAVFGLATIPILLTLTLFVLLARDSPRQPAPKGLRDYATVLKHADTWWFCGFYSVTFGGFVGLAVFLNSFFFVQYGLDRVQAGYFATLCVISGSFLRPVGGYLADRFGGIRMLTILYVGAGMVLLGLAMLPALLPGTVLMFVAMGMLGMGNGSVFQLVPQRFPKEIGVITGIVGAAGGIGGFFLPNLLGGLKQLTDSFAGGFLAFGLTAFTCAVALTYVARNWERGFVGRGGLASAASSVPMAASVTTVEMLPVTTAAVMAETSPTG